MQYNYNLEVQVHADAEDHSIEITIMEPESGDVVHRTFSDQDFDHISRCIGQEVSSWASMASDNAKEEE